VGFPSKKDQFRPGQSGNAAGSSTARRVTAALLSLISEKQADKSLATVWLRKALEGDRHFFRYLLDRVDGAVTDVLVINDQSKPNRIKIPGAAGPARRRTAPRRAGKRKPAP
jgi:hypothetical protein